MNTTRYIGITLGPITRIMSYTRSTRSLWRASYFMSYLAKKLIEFFYNKGRPFKKPLLSKAMWDKQDGVGRFPDQYIFEAKEGDFEKLLEKRKEVLGELSEQIAKSLACPEDKSKIFNYLKDTLKIYILELNEYKSEESIVDECQQALSVMECRDHYPLLQKRNYLAEYFESGTESDWLVKDAFGVTGKFRLFQSIIECLTAKLPEKDKIDVFKDEDVAKLPAKYKYIAFVSSDGDHVGEAIAKLGNSMSEVLWNYSIGLTEIVNGFGGEVIYSGGDDLLFFAPADNIFNLINEIDKSFNNCLTEIETKLEEHKIPKPTLSFGISVSYYKHPMSESIALSESLLDKAKKGGRNRIVWNLRKHSGQSVKSVFDKNQAGLFEKAIDLINSYGNESDLFLHSLAHYLLSHESILKHILSEDDDSAREQELKNYLSSTFEDDAHARHVPNLEKLRAYLLDLAKVEENKEEAVMKLHAILRYIELFTLKPDKKMRYLVILKPAGSYFFGGEVTLGDGTTQNYNVISNVLPQAASLLGLMRYEILRQKNMLSYDASDTDVLNKVKELIGEGGFSLSEERKSFGIIEKLSPVFLYKPSKERFFTVERVDISQKGADEKKEYTVNVSISSKNRCSYFVDDVVEDKEKMKGCMEQIQIPTFNAKTQDFNTYWCDKDRNRIPNPFTYVGQIGITKNEKKDNEKDAFFKQEMVRLDPSLCMAFTVDVKEGNNIEATKHWVYLGGNRSLFEMSIQQTKIDFCEYFKPLHVDGSLLALGDAFLSDEDKRKCLFVWGMCKPCRYMENPVDQKHSWHKPKKGNLYYLQERGSVVYADAESLNQLLKSKFQNLGLNIFI